MTQKYLVVFGTRPEAIKMAPVIAELKTVPGLEVRVCVTGQHRQMLDQVLRLFEIKPDYDLNLMQKAQSLTSITCRTLEGTQEILKNWRPDLVFVHGDTTTSFSASLAAFYEKIPVAHVEAGLRTGDIYSPWPEELNRKLVGSMTKLHFAPTPWAAENLIKEGFCAKNIFVTGNTVIDALMSAREKMDKCTDLQRNLSEQFNYLDPHKKMILVTGHRRENFGTGIEEICMALAHLSKKSDIEIVYPVHMNPAIEVPVKKILSSCSNVYLIPPQDYVPFVYLMNRSHIIITDSGGIQEEAPALGKPVLVTRNTSERPEAIDAGTVKLVGTNPEKIFYETTLLLDDQKQYLRMSKSHNPYGDGRAAFRIKNILMDLPQDQSSQAFAVLS